MNAMRKLHVTAPARQHGAAALIVTMMLFFAMVLVAVFVNRNLVFEQRTSANQYRSTQAFEAAEAGIEWAIAQLNGTNRIGADCLTSSETTATSFRARYLGFNHASAVFTPTAWLNGPVAMALQPSCVRGAAGWSCSCPASGAPALTPPAGAAAAPAFSLQFLPSAAPGVVRIAANGCTSLAGACLPGSATRPDASARIEVTLGLLAAVRTPPAAAVTARGAFLAEAPALGLHNPDPATGIAVHAGRSIAAGHARLTTPAGSSLASALVGGDASLAGLDTDQFFAGTFGIDKATWKNQPAVTRLSCSGDCGAALTSLIDAAAGSALVWVDGDLTLAGPITLGSATSPVVLVVSGAARLDGAVGLHGVLSAASVDWNHASGGAFVRGAVLTEADYQGDGAPEFFYDTAVLGTLASDAGSFARVSGSWHDF